MVTSIYFFKASDFFEAFSVSIGLCEFVRKMSNEILCYILRFQSHSLILRQLIQAESGLKEYKADWLTNAKVVTRDATGRFASKGSSIKQSVQDTTAILKQGFDLTTDTIQSLLKDPEFRKRAGLAAGLPMAKLISNLATQARLNPKSTEKLDEWIANATKEFADQYGDDKNPMAQAIRKANLAQPPKDASFNEKMEFRVAQFAAYKEALESPEDYSKRDELIGKAAAAAIPIGISLAIALGFEVAIPLFMAQGVNWATVLSSVAIGEAADFAVQKGMDKLEINNPALRIGASMVAGALAGGLVTGVNNKIKNTERLAKEKTERLAKEESERLVDQGVKEFAKKEDEQLAKENAKRQLREEVEQLAKEESQKSTVKQVIREVTKPITERFSIHVKTPALGKTGIHWRYIESEEHQPSEVPSLLKRKILNNENHEHPLIVDDLLDVVKPSLLIFRDGQDNKLLLEVTGIESPKRSERMGRKVLNSIVFVADDNIEREEEIRKIAVNAIESFLGRNKSFQKMIEDAIDFDGLEEFRVDVSVLEEYAKKLSSVNSKINTKIDANLDLASDKYWQNLIDDLKGNRLPKKWINSKGDIQEDGVLVAVTDSLEKKDILHEIGAWMGAATNLSNPN